MKTKLLKTDERLNEYRNTVQDQKAVSALSNQTTKCVNFANTMREDQYTPAIMREGLVLYGLWWDLHNGVHTGTLEEDVASAYEGSSEVSETSAQGGTQ